MNLEAAEHPITKVSWTETNVANLVEAHLKGLVPELFESPLPGVWLTGSNVWRFAYGDVPNPTADIDIVVGSQDERDEVIARLGLTWQQSTSPSNPRPEARGAKYLDSKGRTVDIWDTASMHTVTAISGTLEIYPHHSHAQCKVAYSPANRGLFIMPNRMAK